MFTASGNKIQTKQTEEEVYHVILLSGKAPAVTCWAMKFFPLQRKQEEHASWYLIKTRINQLWFPEKATEITKLRVTSPKAFQRGLKEILWENITLSFSSIQFLGLQAGEALQVNLYNENLEKEFVIHEHFVSYTFM